MNIIDAFETAKNGKLVKHPELPEFTYKYKTKYGTAVLCEIDRDIDLIITEELLYDWEVVE